MTIQVGAAAGPSALQAVPNFRSWQRDTLDRGLLPVIGIAGGRGKSTVARMIDAIFQRAHLRTALWTDLGVEIRGKRQRGEISGWSLALRQLTEFSIDVAIQELDWSTINAVGLPPGSYPLLAVTNMMSAPESEHEDLQVTIARRAALRVAGAVHRDGALVIGGDDPSLIDCARATDASVAVTSLSRDVPNLKYHLEDGGAGVWVEDHTIRTGDLETYQEFCATVDIAAGHGGLAQFEIANALTAIALGISIGIDIETIHDALRTFEIAPAILPGSFNTYEVNGHKAVIDRAAPSWHLRHVLRAVNPGSRKRQLSVIGNLERLPVHDIQEVGRLLGRYSGAIILHSNKDLSLVDSLRKGIASNDFPPLVIHLPTERRALNRALKTARPDDVVLILTDLDAGPATRALQRQVNNWQPPISERDPDQDSSAIATTGDRFEVVTVT
jgi:cyanophycin synthetase